MKKNYSIAYLKNIKKINLPINIITRIFLSQFSPLVKRFVNKKILDYSCGSGPYLNLFNSLGLKVHATEISTAITNELKKNSKILFLKKVTILTLIFLINTLITFYVATVYII